MKYFYKKEHRHWIQDYGFEEETKTVIGLPCQYERCVYSESDLYCIWIGIDFDNLLVHLYVEYECGGEVSRDTISLEDVDIDDEQEFMSKLEAMISRYMED
jgi:hypothetical protein